MRLKQKLQQVLIIGLVMGMLAACATVPSPTALSDMAEPSGAQELPAAMPIVGTAISDGSQEMPLPTATMPAEINGAQTITVDQNGQTLTFQPGDRFALMLGSGYTWDVGVLNPEIVDQASEPAPAESQGLYEALQAGQTELNASGDPLCRTQKPACMMPSISFTIKIIVSR